jgi:hypothetical protein
MSITTVLTMDDLLGLSPQAQINLNRTLDWIGEVNSTVGSVAKELRVVASTAAIKAIAAADRAEGDVAFLADSGQCVYFSEASSAVESLGPPITVIQPTAGTGRWLALALPPVASVAAAQLASSAVTVAKIGAATAADAGQTIVPGVSYTIALNIPNTAGTTDFVMPAVITGIKSGRFVPDATVGALSTIQIQTAAGANNVTEAMDISAATVGLAQNFTTFIPDYSGFAAGATLRVVTAGTDVAGILYLDCFRL